MSTDLELLKLKRKMCEDEGFHCRDFGTQKSGYGGTKTIHNFYTRVHPEITKVFHASIADLIITLDKEELFLWYMDDGSWHKGQNLVHLYCNMLNDDECDVLIRQIHKLYGVRPTKRLDRKKDGRQFNYLYFPRKLVLRFRPEFKKYAMSKGLTSMYYKFGGINYSDELEKLNEHISAESFDKIMRTYTTARRFDKDVKLNASERAVRIQWRNSRGITQERNIAV